MTESPAKQFLSSKGRSAPVERVSLHLIDDSGTEQREAENVPAVLRYVSDKVQTTAAESAARVIAGMEAKGAAVTPEIRAAYEQAHLLHEILRNPAAPMEPFFDSPEEVRQMVPAAERVRLLGAWGSWIERKFPGDITPEAFKEAMADAKVFTVSALLGKYGYATTRSCVISLALTQPTSPTD